MFCPNCGTKALENAKFCMECGAKLPTQNTSTQTNKENISHSQKWLEGLSPRLQQAALLAEEDNYQKSLELAKEEMKEKLSLDALDYIYDNYIALGQKDNAKQTLKKMEEMGASSAWIDLNKALLCMIEGDTQEAEKLLKQTLEHKQDLPSKRQVAIAYYMLACVQVNLEKIDFNIVSKAFELKEYIAPSGIGVLYKVRGTYYHEKELYNKAYEDFMAAEKAGLDKDVSFYLLRAVAGQESEQFGTFLDDIDKLINDKDHDFQALGYWRRGLYYYNNDKDEKAYEDFMNADKAGIEKSIDFCYFRAMAGASCGQLEHVQNDIDFILKSDADETVKKVITQLQEKLGGNKPAVLITKETFKEANSKFYDKTLEALERYKEETDFHTAVEMLSSDSLKLMMKHSVRNIINYWEETFSPIMTSQIQKNFISAKKDIKAFVAEEFNPIAERADELIEEIKENIPEDSWLEIGKKFFEGAVTGYFTGGIGVIKTLFDEAEENKSINRIANRWNKYVQDILHEYDEVYSNITDKICNFIDEHKIPIEISEDDDKDDDD